MVVVVVVVVVLDILVVLVVLVLVHGDGGVGSVCQAIGVLVSPKYFFFATSQNHLPSSETSSVPSVDIGRTTDRPKQ